MDISTNSPTVTGVNSFPQPINITPAGTTVNTQDLNVVQLVYQFTAGSYILSNLGLQIQTVSRSASADFINLNIPGPASAMPLSTFYNSYTPNSQIVSATQQAINTYLTTTPAISGMPISIVYTGNAKVGTWTVSITGNAPDYSI